MLLDRSSEVPRLLADLDAIIERSREAVEAATRPARALIETGEEFGWCFLSLAQQELLEVTDAGQRRYS